MFNLCRKRMWIQRKMLAHSRKLRTTTLCQKMFRKIAMSNRGATKATSDNRRSSTWDRKKVDWDSEKKIVFMYRTSHNSSKRNKPTRNIVALKIVSCINISLKLSISYVFTFFQNGSFTDFHWQHKYKNINGNCEILSVMYIPICIDWFIDSELWKYCCGINLRTTVCTHNLITTVYFIFKMCI